MFYLFNIDTINDMFDLKALRKAYGLTQKEMADILGYGQTNVSEIERNQKNIEPAAYKILCDKYGEDTIRKYQLPGITNINDKRNRMLTESVGPRINYNNGVPYYDVDFMAGFDLILNDSSVNPEYLIDFRKYNEATCWCNVSGHSMEPEINHGDIVALKAIADPSFLPYGEVYAIVTTNDMRTIKRLAPSQNPDNYLLVPTNKSPEYGVQELPKRFILKIFKVLGCMKRL